MLYRCFKKKDTGQWLDVLFTVDGATFEVPEESHRTDIATTIGLLSDELEAVDAVSDLRTGTLLELPAPPAEQPTRIQELIAIPRSSWTTAQMRELIDLIAQEVTK